MTNLPDGDDSATPENAEAAEAAAQEAESRAAAARARARDLRRLAESEAAPKAEVLTATDDLIPTTRGRRVRWGALRQRAREWIAAYGVKTQGEGAQIRTLSGGNVQRAVLARELAEDADLLLVSNPVFGLDFAAVAEIHGRLLAARDRGAAVLLVSEDLDELLDLADRIVVMSEGRIVHDVAADAADRQSLGHFMGGRPGGDEHPGDPTDGHEPTAPAALQRMAA